MICCQNLFHLFKQGVEDTSGNSDLPLPDHTHMTCCLRIVGPGNPICPIHLHVLIYSTMGQLFAGFLQLFHCFKEVTSVFFSIYINYTLNKKYDKYSHLIYISDQMGEK